MLQSTLELISGAMLQYIEFRFMMSKGAKVEQQYALLYKTKEAHLIIN